MRIQIIMYEPCHLLSGISHGSLCVSFPLTFHCSQSLLKCTQMTNFAAGQKMVIEKHCSQWLCVTLKILIVKD